MGNNFKIPPAIKEYLDEVKPLVEMAFENKECYNLGTYYKEIQNRLISHFGVENKNRVLLYIGSLTSHGGDSIRNYIRATDYCDSLSGAFHIKEYNSIAPGSYLQLGNQSITDGDKKRIIERKLVLTDIRKGVRSHTEPEPPIIGNDLLAKVQRALSQLTEIEQILKPKSEVGLTEAKYRSRIEYEYALHYFDNGKCLTEIEFMNKYKTDRKVTIQAAALAFKELLRRRYIKVESRYSFGLTELGKEELKKRMVIIEQLESYGNKNINQRVQIWN